MGVTLAIIGALLLTPDTLLMRLSQLDGWNMLIWRGSLSGVAYLIIWAMLDGWKSLSKITTLSFSILLCCQLLNVLFFSLAIALAPVVIVLLGVATVPVFAALLSRFILNEPLSKLTLVTAFVVLAGLSISLLGHDVDGATINETSVIGLLLGLGVAFALAMNFTMIRKDQDAPFVLAMALGAMCAACVGYVCANNLQWLPPINMLSIGLTGICILPLSFIALSYAARNVKSSTVSLIMLSETVLGPLWVWWGVGESPNRMMVIGGTVVLAAIATYIVLERRNGALESA
ncbi:DMT family transporter [Thalassobium sp. R2A62]|uniref:DMT family transporter n=1 Tax=Thalassobium sp. R2A62 TaxID=633131 RepID=UPI0001B1D452|nr:membrane protein [Thalassobium sp. R2A62]